MTPRRGRRDHPVRPRPADTLEQPVIPPGAHPPVRPRPRPRPTSPVKRTWLNALTNTTRNTLLTPTPGTRARVVRIWAIITPPELNSITLELYLGLGANATTDRAKLIDMLRTGTSATTIQTRTWDSLAIGRAPTGDTDEVVSYRWGSTPAIDHDHRIIIEYTEELNLGRET